MNLFCFVFSPYEISCIVYVGHDIIKRYSFVTYEERGELG